MKKDLIACPGRYLPCPSNHPGSSSGSSNVVVDDPTNQCTGHDELSDLPKVNAYKTLGKYATQDEAKQLWTP